MASKPDNFEDLKNDIRRNVEKAIQEVK